MTIPQTTIGEVLQLTRRPVSVEAAATYSEIGIRSFGRGIFHKETVTGADLGTKRVFHIEPNDLVVSNVFAWEGAIAVAGETERGRIGSHRFMTYVPRDGRIDTTWVAWFLRSERGMELVGKASPGSAGRNRTLAIQRFEALEIPLPSLESQRHVGARLDRLDQRVAGMRAELAKAKTLTSAFLVASALRADLDAARKTRAGWRRVSLGDVLTPSSRGVQVDPTVSYPIAGIYSFGRGLIDRGALPGAGTSYSRLTRLRIGDIVVSKLNGWEGAVAVVDDRFDGFHVSGEYPSFEPDSSQLLPGYFAGIARAPSFWRELDEAARGSMVRRRRIGPSEFLSVQVWLPPLDVQTRTAAAIHASLEVMNSRASLEAGVSALVPAAMNDAFGSLD